MNTPMMFSSAALPTLTDEPAQPAPVAAKPDPAAALQGVTVSAAGPASTAPGFQASIGDILGHAGTLDALQVERILAYQRQHGVRFGEAAMALGMASSDDVAQALSHQFRYPFSPSQHTRFHPDLLMAQQPFSAHAEVFRSVRAQLKMRLAVNGQARRMVAVVSAEQGDGKSYFAANVAVAFSQLSGRTLLIDANLRQPRLHTLFASANDSGLSNMLSGRADTLVVDPLPGLPNLFLLPVGAVPPNPLELVESDGLARLLAQVAQKFDQVVVDTPAFSQGMDAAVIAAACGAALVVVRKGRSRLAATQDLVAAATDGGALVAGVVLNHRR
jgi:protein-tyrosine kinase